MVLISVGLVIKLGLTGFSGMGIMSLGLVNMGCKLCFHKILQHSFNVRTLRIDCDQCSCGRLLVWHSDACRRARLRRVSESCQ